MRVERLRGYGLALVAASLWATLGLFYRALGAHGLPAITIVFYRALVAAVVLFPLLAWRQPASLRLAWREGVFFAAFGLFGVAAFYIVYIYAINLAGMGMAAVLMYTAPAWVTLLSVPLLGERLSGLKVAAVLIAVGGCALVGRIYDPVSVRVNLPGILAGLGAGLAYGLYTLFSKVAQRRHTPWATLAYALGLGALFMLPLQSPGELLRALTTPATLVWLLALGLVPTLAGGVAFNAALRRVPASNASVVATLEPVIAGLLGWAFLHERLDPLQWLGAAMILLAVLTLQWTMTGDQ